MATINWRRVLVGGLVAGVVVGLVWLPVLAILRTDIGAALQSLGLSIDPVSRLALYGVIAIPAAGIVAVWMYAAIRPRYGPGPRTAVIAAFATWFITLLVDAGWASLGVVSFRLFVIAKATDVAALILGTLAGARLYREPLRSEGAV